jgi:hypothetical protein
MSDRGTQILQCANSKQICSVKLSDYVFIGNCSKIEQADSDYLYKCKYNGFTCDKCNETVANKSDLNTHDYHIQKNSDTELSNLFQVDGNISIPGLGDSTLFLNKSSHYSSSIPVVVSSRTSFLPQLERRACFNRHIRKDNNLLEAINLLAFTVYNMRSLWSKVNSLGEDIIERDVAISFLSEVWEKKENVLHQSCIQELLELKVISYISTPQPGARRGGGTAIAACPKKFSLVKLNIDIPNAVEVVWGLLRPKKIIGRIRKIILCSFYCPPRSKKKTILIAHISTVLNKLKVDHPDAATIIAGDKKKNPPSSLDDLRNISGTPFFSKQYESFLSDWLLPTVDPFLDPGQCGGLKKSSISHILSNFSILSTSTLIVLTLMQSCWHV